MPTIPINDQFGLSVDATAGDLSSFTKYCSSLPQLSVADFNLNAIAGLTLADPALTSAKAGLNFAQPVNIGAGGVTFTLNAGVNGSLDVFVPPPSGGLLLNPDPYGDDIAVSAPERYVSLAVSVTAGPDIQMAMNQLAFSFQAGATISVATYCRFETQPAAPLLIDAIKETVAAFCIPGSVDDLRALPAGSLVTLEGTGTLTAGGSANLLTVANPLAALSLPSGVPSLEVSAGGSVTVGATCQITWDYQLRVHKLDAARITLGFYRKQGSKTTVSVNLAGGISAGTSTTDLFSAVIGAVSPSAKVDPATLATLGMSQSQINGIQSAVNSAAQRKLEVALLASLTATDSSQAAFLYEFDLTALDNAGSAMLVSALRGNVSGLGVGTLPPGITVVRTLFTNLQSTGWTWKLNLLGIYNYISVSELVRQGTVLYEPSTGDLVLTDSATASQISAATLNFGADTQKLRHVLAGSLLITAAYHGTVSTVQDVDLACSHTFFELNAATDSSAMQGELDIAAALGLIDNSGEQKLMGSIGDFSQSLVYAENSYSSGLAAQLFLDGGAPRTEQQYQTAGRGALQLLIREGAPDDYRRRPAIDDDLWAKMLAAGPFNFSPLFPGLTDLQIEVIAADYTAIVWWADAMSSCGSRLSAMQKQLTLDPNQQSPAFQALRQDLAQHLANAAGQTRDEFGKPWGLVAMDLVSGRQAKARVQVICPRIAVALSRGPAAQALSA